MARRRPSITPGPSLEPAEPQAPRGAPTAVFAGILDGQSLWVAIDATPGSLDLRDTVSGDVVALTNDAPDDQPAYTSARMDLQGLAGSGTMAYDVVLVPVGGRSPKPVWIGSLSPARVAPAADETRQFGLARTDEGWLRITRTTLDPTAWLTGIEEVGEGIRLSIEAATTPDQIVALLADGEPVATYPVSQQGSTLTVTLTADETLAASIDVQTRVVVGGPGAWVPVRRRHDDLADPGRGAPLPPVTLPGTETPRIRLRFGGEAFLVARILPLDTETQSTVTTAGGDS